MNEYGSKEKWYIRLSRAINSTVCFSFAYIVFTYLFWLSTGLAAWICRYDSFIYYYGIEFIHNDRILTRLRVTLVYSSGALFCALLGLFCWFLFNKLKSIKTMFNVLLLWGFIIGTSIFASQGLISSLGIHKPKSHFYHNFVWVYEYWHIPALLVYIFTIPFLILFLFFAVRYPKPFLYLTHSYSKVNTVSRRRKYFIEIAILPFILGALITTGVTYPRNIAVHGVYIMTIGTALLIGWISLIYIEIPKEDVLKYKTLQVINPYFFFLLFLAIFFVFIGKNGLNIPVRL